VGSECRKSGANNRADREQAKEWIRRNIEKPGKGEITKKGLLRPFFVSVYYGFPVPDAPGFDLPEPDIEFLISVSACTFCIL